MATTKALELAQLADSISVNANGEITNIGTLSSLDISGQIDTTTLTASANVSVGSNNQVFITTDANDYTYLKTQSRLYLQTQDGTATFLRGNTDGVRIYYGSDYKLATTSTGVSVVGVLTVSANVAIDTDTLFVDTVNDRVGINVTPQRAFHVEGATRPALIGSTNASHITKLYNSATGSATYEGMDLGVNSTSEGSITTYGMPFEIQTSAITSSGGITRLSVESNGDIQFYENNSGTPQVGMHWDYTNGNLGIGTTIPNANYPLHVDGIVYAQTGIQMDSGYKVNFGNPNQYIRGTNDTSIEIVTGGTASLTVLDNSNVTMAGDLTVAGDFTVSGNTTFINSDNLAIEDLNIVLANGAANSSIADGAGITIDGASATITYNAPSNSWNLNKSTNFAGSLDAHYYTSDVDGDSVKGGFFLGNTGHGLHRDAGSNDIQLYTSSGKVRLHTDGFNSNTAGLVVDDNNNVGIGIDSPSANGTKRTLHISNTASGAAIRLTQSGGALIRYDDTNGLQVGTISANDLVLETSDITAVVIDGDTQKATFTHIPFVNEVRHSIRPSLLLDFANSKRLDSRLSFTRSSTATYWDGKTTTLAEENLIPTSRYVGGSGWGITSYNVYQDYAAAPDGTTTATKASPTSASAGTSVAISTSVSKTTEAYTWSIYAKIDSADYPAIALYWNSSGSANVRFDIQNGTVTSTTNGSGTITGSIQNVGNGWYRCVSTYSGATSTNATFYVLDSVTNGDWTLSNSPDGVKGILVWGPQIEIRDTVTAYTQTTNRIVRKFQPVLQTATVNTPRFDHNPVTKESKGLLIEEARTNLQAYSESMQNWSYILNVTYLTNYGIAPDGTQTADLVTPNTTNALHYFGIPQSISPGNGNETFSFFVKPVGTVTTYNLHFRTANMNGAQSQTFDFQTGQLGTSGSANVSQSMTPVGNGWYRCSISYTSTKSNPYPTLYFADSTNGNSITLATDGFSGFLIWGSQLEVGSFATSYIPTSGSTVTRSLESILATDDNFDSLWEQHEWTVFSEFSIEQGKSHNYSNGIWGIGNSSSTYHDSISVYYNPYTNQIYSQLYTNGSGWQSAAIGGVVNDATKTAWAYSYDDSAIAVNGTIGYTNSSASPQSYKLDRLVIGNVYSAGSSFATNGYLKKLAIYPTRLSNAELEALTEE